MELVGVERKALVSEPDALTTQPPNNLCNNLYPCYRIKV